MSIILYNSNKKIGNKIINKFFFLPSKSLLDFYDQ